MLDLNLVQNVAIVIVTLLFTAFIAWVLSKLLDKWVHKAVSSSKSGLDDTLLNALKMPLISFVLLMGLWLGLQRADFYDRSLRPVVFNSILCSFSAFGLLGCLSVDFRGD